jgi:copper chaperone CopZ
MDNKIIRILVLLGILLAAGFFIINNQKTSVSVYAVNEEKVENLHEAALKIEGMYCQACSYAVAAQLEKLEGVVSADINYKDASGVVSYDSDKIDAQTIAAASTAYPALVIEDKAI